MKGSQIIRALGRLTFTALACASGLLLAATVALWVRSYRVVDHLEQIRAAARPAPVSDDELRFMAPTGARLDCRYHSRFGRLGIIVFRMAYGGLYGGDLESPDGWSHQSVPVQALKERGYKLMCPTTLGLGYKHSVQRAEQTRLAEVLEARGDSPCRLAAFPPAVETWRIEIHYWLPAALFSVLPAAWAWQRRGRRKQADGRRCGTDFRSPSD